MEVNQLNFFRKNTGKVRKQQERECHKQRVSGRNFNLSSSYFCHIPKTGAFSASFFNKRHHLWQHPVTALSDWFCSRVSRGECQWCRLFLLVGSIFHFPSSSSISFFPTLRMRAALGKYRDNIEYHQVGPLCFYINAADPCSRVNQA